MVLAVPLSAQVTDAKTGAGVSVDFLLAELTPNEKRVLVLLVQGSPPREIAKQLIVSRDYIYVVLRRLRAVFHTRTNAGIVTCALAWGMVVSEDVVSSKEAL